MESPPEERVGGGGEWLSLSACCLISKIDAEHFQDMDLDFFPNTPNLWINSKTETTLVFARRFFLSHRGIFIF